MTSVECCVVDDLSYGYKREERTPGSVFASVGLKAKSESGLVHPAQTVVRRRGRKQLRKVLHPRIRGCLPWPVVVGGKWWNRWARWCTWLSRRGHSAEWSWSCRSVLVFGSEMAEGREGPRHEVMMPLRKLDRLSVCLGSVRSRPRRWGC